MFKKSLATVAALATLSTGPAHAASLQTDIDISLPSVIALYCYDKVTVNVNASGFLTAVGHDAAGSAASNSSATATAAATAGGGEWTASVSGLETEGSDIDTDVDLTMTGVCAFRAVAGSTGVDVSVTLDDGVLKNTDDATNTIVASTANVKNASGAWVSTYNVAPADLGFGTVKPISVQMPLDLSNAKLAGNYTNTGTFTVSVVPGV